MQGNGNKKIKKVMNSGSTDPMDMFIKERANSPDIESEFVFVERADTYKEQTLSNAFQTHVVNLR